MRSSLITGTSYLPGTVLDSTVHRRVMDLNALVCDSLTLGGAFQIPGNLKRIIEIDRKDDSVVINGFVNIDKQVFHLIQRVAIGNEVYSYTDVRGISMLINFIASNQSVSSLRDFVSDLVIAKSTDSSDFEESAMYRENCNDPVLSNMDNEGSSIYDTIDGFKEQYLVDAVLDGFEDNLTMYSCLDYFDAEEAGLDYCRDIIKSLTPDEIFTSGIITTYDILSNDGTGAKLDIIRQLTKPYLNDKYELNRNSEIYLTNPVLSKDEFLRYLCSNRRYVNRQRSQLEPVVKFSQELMNWLTMIHSSIIEGRFTYILPERSIKNACTRMTSNNFCLNYKFRQGMREFTTVFSELIDFSSAREFDISITPTEELFISFREKDKIRTLYFDLLLTSVLSYGLIRNVNA